MTGLCAGWAREDITPEAGIHMGGYWGRRSGATGVHDSLGASVILWRRGGGPADVGAALVALDLVGVTSDMAGRLREQVVSAAGSAVSLTPEAVTVCCSHTHAGPLTMPFRGMGEVDGSYLERVCVQVGRAAAKAAEGLRPVGLRYARPSVRIGINRRQARRGGVVIGEDPRGPVASHAHVVVFEAVHPARRAVLFQHACHPVVLPGSNHEISADFPGPARRVVEERTGALAVYVNGAAGDINPRGGHGSFDAVESLGAELGTAVAEAADRADERDEDGIGWSRERLALPLIPPSPAMGEEVRGTIGDLEAAVSGAGEDPWERRVPEARLAWARQWLAGAGREAVAGTQPFEVHGLRIGPLVLLGLEGEIFVRYQLDLERECGMALIVCGYANGCVGYVPTADEYARGGYEIDQAYKVYPSVRMIAPESEGIVRAGAWRVLEGLGVPRR